MNERKADHVRAIKWCELTQRDILVQYCLKIPSKTMQTETRLGFKFQRFDAGIVNSISWKATT